MKKILILLLAMATCCAQAAIISGAATNATTLNGATFAAPGPIGSGTPSTGAFTTLSASGNTTLLTTAQLAFGTGTGATAGMRFIPGTGGSGATGYAFIYPENVTASGTNYGVGIRYTGQQTMLNAATGGTVDLNINDSLIARVNSTGFGVTGTITASAIASSGAAQSGYLCYNTSGGVITYDGGATCLISLEETKDRTSEISGATALSDVMALRPFWGKYRTDTPMTDHREQPFFGAHQVESVDPRLVTYTDAGALHGVRYQNITAVLTAAIQEQQRRIVLLQWIIGLMLLAACARCYWNGRP